MSFFGENDKSNISISDPNSYEISFETEPAPFQSTAIILKANSIQSDIPIATKKTGQKANDQILTSTNLVIRSPTKRLTVNEKVAQIEAKQEKKRYTQDPEQVFRLLQVYDDNLSFVNDRQKNKDKDYLWCRFFPTIKPNNTFVIIWKLIIAALIVFYIYEIPVYVVFGQAIWNGLLGNHTIVSLVIFSMILFLADILLEFLTAYYLHGNLVINKRKVAQHYLKTYFIFDLIAVLGFTVRVSAYTDTYRAFYFLFYFKLPSLLKINSQFAEMILLKRNLRTMHQILEILLYMYFCINIYGCFFFRIGKFCSEKGEQSWVNQQNIFGKVIDMQPSKQYFYSIYFALATLSSTIGYGDIIPENFDEQLYGLFGIIFGIMIFALNINNLFKIMEDHNQFERKLFDQKVAINKFMISKNVPDDLSERIRQYLNESWFDAGTRDLELEQQILSSLAPELREELMYSSYGTFFQEIPFFRDNFSRGFLKELSQYVQEIRYAQGEKIFEDRQGRDDQSFYYIVSGQVIIYPDLDSRNEIQDHAFKKLKPKDYFGEWGFFTNLPRQASAKAYTYSLLYKIKRDVFLEVLDRYPDDLEQYCQIRDQLIQNSNYSCLNSNCWTCGCDTHYCSNCTVTHYKPQTSDVIYYNNFVDKEQVRLKIKRGTRPPWSTLKNTKKLTFELGKTQLAKKVVLMMKQMKMKQLRQTSRKLEEEKEEFRGEDSEASPLEILPELQEKKIAMQTFASNYQNNYQIHLSMNGFDKAKIFKYYMPNFNFSNFRIFRDADLANFLLNFEKPPLE